MHWRPNCNEKQRLEMISLRPYQQSAVDNIRQSFATGSKSVLCVLPTGGGKTVIFSHIAATSSARGKRVLILVHRIELLRQTARALQRAGIQPGLVNPKYTPDYNAPVQVAMVQTMTKRAHFFKKGFDLIVTDECHHVVSKTYRDILDAFPKAYQLGVTATPVRGDGKGLGIVAGGVYDTLVVGPTVAELIAGGYLVKPAIYAPKDRLDLSAVRTRMGDYDKHELESVVDKPRITGNAVEHYRKAMDGLPAVVFCISVKHAQHVAAEFQAAGYKAYAVDGSMEDEQRSHILGGLANGTVQVVTSCDIISEGTDIPAIAGAILLRPTQSAGLYLQQVGRALRPMAGKERAVILDHVGNVITHGLPDEDRAWSLDGEEKKKKKKKDNEDAPKVRQCTACYAMFEAEALACPECGTLVPVSKGRQVNQAEGELREITDLDRIKLSRTKSQEIGRARTLADLEQIAKQRGYKPGWAKHIWEARNKKQEFVTNLGENAGILGDKK